MKEIESTPTTHPELWSYCWVRFGERWTLQPRISHEWSKESAFAAVLHTETEWTWCVNGIFDFCETFADARSCAEQAVADWLRSDGE